MTQHQDPEPIAAQSGILSRLSQAVTEYDAQATDRLAREAIEAGISPSAGLDTLMDTIRRIGDLYGRGELFLPDLIMAGEAMKSGSRGFRGRDRARGNP